LTSQNVSVARRVPDTLADQERTDTNEGLEVSMSLLYYSRIRFINNLLPLLTAAPEPAHVISVYAAGMESSGKFYPDDLSLTRDSKAHYTFANCRSHCIHMKTMYFEHLAQKHEGKLSFVHVYPGLVIGPNFWHESLPTWFKIIWFFMYPIANVFSTAPEESGKRTLYFASDKFPAGGLSNKNSNEAAPMSTDRVKGGGAYSCKYDDEVYDVSKAYKELRPKGFRERVVKETDAAFAVIESGKRFKEW
jgi:hypothetical protein